VTRQARHANVMVISHVQCVVSPSFLHMQVHSIFLLSILASRASAGEPSASASFFSTLLQRAKPPGKQPLGSDWSTYETRSSSQQAVNSYDSGPFASTLTPHSLLTHSTSLSVPAQSHAPAALHPRSETSDWLALPLPTALTTHPTRKHRAIHCQPWLPQTYHCAGRALPLGHASTRAVSSPPNLQTRGASSLPAAWEEEDTGTRTARDNPPKWNPSPGALVPSPRRVHDQDD
jgi:hypothetical protein